MIVRGASARALVHVGEDAKAEFRVLIQELTGGVVVRPEVFLYELLFHQHFLQAVAHFLKARLARIRFQYVVALGRESIENFTHDALSLFLRD